MKGLTAMLMTALMLLAASARAETWDAAYRAYLFDDTYVHRIDVTVDADAYRAMAKEPLNKAKLDAEITVDGETYRHVIFSVKGATSLQQVAKFRDLKERYSYKLRFGSAEGSETYHGLDCFVLNNSVMNASCMRDMLAYRLFRLAGVPAPYTAYTELYINGELRGLYLAVESEEEAFTARCFGGGNLYEPEPTFLTEYYARRNAEITAEGPTDEAVTLPLPTFPVHYDTPGADLKYTDDDPASYADILNGACFAVTDESTAALTGALKRLSEGKIAEAVDADEVIRYFAALNLLVSWDSYMSKMLHNYVLHERNGILSMLPWDYDLAFTAMMPAHEGQTEHVL